MKLYVMNKTRDIFNWSISPCEIMIKRSCIIPEKNVNRHIEP